MKLFGPLYERALVWARHPKAPALLTGLSFAEAIVFPVMPEVMLAPMCLSQPKRGFWFATLSLAGSLAGAVVGYLLGHYAYELVTPLLENLGWLDKIEAQVATLREITAESPWKAFWLLVIAGFTPIPLKIFTWASGIVGVPMLPFLAAMVVGRGKRVFLV
nr:DedA family protein [Pseudomonadota bacterium]